MNDLESVGKVKAWLTGLQQGVEELQIWLTNNDARLAGLQAALEELRTWNLDLTEHLRTGDHPSGAPPEPDELGLERFEAEGVGTVIGYQHGDPPVAPDQDYIAFEDVFRQSEEVIRERQRPYVGLLGDREPVLDAGCGRGEFLELLREAGISARGVELDAGMVARTRAKGLEVEQGDVVEYLDRLEDGSLGALFAAQVVEHLPYPELLAFLRLGWAKLRSGALLIAETVNPHAPWALKNFWFDLTHQHPIFPEVLLTLCRGIGFDSAYVFHPAGTGNVDVDRTQCGDYAIVAQRR
jgi:methionine biosynthesis protein MetW